MIVKARSKPMALVRGQRDPVPDEALILEVIALLAPELRKLDRRLFENVRRYRRHDKDDLRGFAVEIAMVMVRDTCGCSRSAKCERQHRLSALPPPHASADLKRFVQQAVWGSLGTFVAGSIEESMFFTILEREKKLAKVVARVWNCQEQGCKAKKIETLGDKCYGNCGTMLDPVLIPVRAKAWLVVPGDFVPVAHWNCPNQARVQESKSKQSRCGRNENSEAKGEGIQESEGDFATNHYFQAKNCEVGTYWNENTKQHGDRVQGLHGDPHDSCLWRDCPHGNPSHGPDISWLWVPKECVEKAQEAGGPARVGGMAKVKIAAVGRALWKSPIFSATTKKKLLLELGRDKFKIVTEATKKTSRIIPAKELKKAKQFLRDFLEDHAGG